MSNIGDMLVDVKGLKSVHDSIKNTFSTKQELTNVDSKFSEVNSARQSGNGTTYNNLKARLDADKAESDAEIAALNESLDDVKADLGDKSNLKTLDKTNIVSAINSLNGKAADAKATRDAFTAMNTSLQCVQKAVDANNVSFTTGGYIATNKDVSDKINLTPMASAGYAYSVVGCKYDDVFVLTGTGGGTPRLWAFVDANNALISKSDAGLTAEGIILTAPYNAKKLIINVSIDDNNKYSCIKHPSDFVQDLSNSAKINIEFDASQYINTSGDAVACTVGVDGTEFTKAYNFSYCCAVVPCAYGGKIQITGKSMSSDKHVWTFVNKNGTAISKASRNADLTDEVISVPKNASYCIINARMDSAFSATLFFAKKTLESDYSFSSGYVATPSANNSINYTPVSSTDFVHAVIDCVKGQKFKITGVTENNSGKRLYCFADLSGYCRYRYNDTAELIDTEITAPINGKLIVNALVNRDYAVTDNYSYALRSPLTTLPPAFMGSMAFKPMWSLSKGYICLMTDDGYDNGTDKGLVQETIPLAIAKNVPFTFALMRDSDVCKDSTLIAAVKDAVANHGCSIAQHGEFVWHNKSEDMLNMFFDLEKEFWESEEIEVKGAVIPAHYTTELVKAVCGGRFGVVRSGYDGIVPDTHDPAYTVTNHYSYYTSGERSNLYCLSSYNNSSATDAYNQSAVDYAYENNKILICYFHENAMDATKWGVVSDMIDYAKTKGLEFITLGDIPHIL